LAKAGVEADGWDADRIAEYLTRDKDAFALDFAEYGLRVAERVDREGRKKTAHLYRTAVRVLAEYAPELDIKDITSSFLKGFDRYLSERSVSERSKLTYLSEIRAIHNIAKKEFNDEDRGTIRIPYSPFSGFEMPRRGKGRHRALTVEQTQRLLDLPYEGGNFDLAKDAFVLSFALMGMNMIDLYKCTDTDGSVITYRRSKTSGRRADGAEISVRVEPEIRRLVDKYKGKDRVFSFSERYSSFDSFYNAVKNSLKEVGRRIGVPDLTTYYARHTFATVAANKAGIDIYTVDEMLNHSDASLKLARVYVERDYSLLWEANRRVLSLFDWGFYERLT
jgi:integrase